jgi:hypothetical protein
MTPDTIRGLVASTNPTMGDYVVELYGNTYIHQCQTSGSIIAYQQDIHGKLYLIDTICRGQQVQQLSAASDGRHFAFITYDSQPETNTQQIGDAYVFYLDTINKCIEQVYTWPIHSVGELVTPQAPGVLLFFSLNGKFAVFADSNMLHIQALYTDDTEHRINMSCSVEGDWEDLGCSQSNGFIQGSDYLLWHKPSSHLAMVDLLSDGRVEQHNLSPSIQLESAHLGCWLHNDYLIHVNPKTLCADIYHVNPVEHTVTRTESIDIGQTTAVQCALGPDSQSVILHYADTATARLVQLRHLPATTTL